MKRDVEECGHLAVWADLSAGHMQPATSSTLSYHSFGAEERTGNPHQLTC